MPPLSSLRDALLHRLLTRGVPGWHSEWKDVRGLGTIPASWDVVRLGDVAEGRQAALGVWYKPDHFITLKVELFLEEAIT